jgi:GxxExxY protein
MNRGIKEINRLTERIIGAAIDVHKALGPGLLESAYETCLSHELNLRNIRFHRQVPLPIVYKGISLDCSYRVDLLVDERVVLEIKSVEQISNIHKAQILTYLRLGGWNIGLILNFNVPLMIKGVYRFVQNLDDTG